MNTQEFIDLYTEQGTLSGERILKSEAHRLGKLHKSVLVWIINDKGELLVQKRNPNKDINPNLLDTSFAGHIQAGESSTETAIREAKEELNLDIDLNKLEFLFSCKDKSFHPNGLIEYEIEDVYLYKDNINILNLKFIDHEVIDIKYIDYKKIETMWKNNDVQIVKHTNVSKLLPFILHERYDKT